MINNNEGKEEGAFKTIPKRVCFTKQCLRKLIYLIKTSPASLLLGPVGPRSNGSHFLPLFTVLAPTLHKVTGQMPLSIIYTWKLKDSFTNEKLMVLNFKIPRYTS